MYLVRLCMDMQTGRFRHYPQPGAALDQHPTLIGCMRMCWYTWYVNEYKPANNLAFTLEDTEFMRDLLPENYQPKSHYNREAVKEAVRDVKHG